MSLVEIMDSRYLLDTMSLLDVQTLCVRKIIQGRGAFISHPSLGGTSVLYGNLCSSRHMVYSRIRYTDMSRERVGGLWDLDA